MKEYSFSYTDQRLLILILIACVLIIFGEMTLINHLLFDIIDTDNLVIYLFILIAPILVLMKSTKWINKHATAILTQEKLELVYKGKTQTFEFKDIKKVQVDHFNGVLLRISTQSNKKIKFAANHLTTSTTELRKFSKDLKETLEHFNLSRIEAKVELPKNILEKKLGLYLLIGASIIMVIGVIYIRSIGKNLTGPLIVSFGILASLWTGYLIQKK